MTAPTPPPVISFRCSICDEPSIQICRWCTKDTCGNHVCDRCGRCSDCCVCEAYATGRGDQRPRGRT